MDFYKDFQMLGMLENYIGSLIGILTWLSKILSTYVTHFPPFNFSLPSTGTTDYLISEY